jgi:hypothetical protein
MARFRKKPVEIEAWMFGGLEPRPAWLREALERGSVWFQGGSAPYYTIATLEGEMRAREGDWIIQGVKGLYPCKPDIFAATYEPVAR